MIDSRLICLLKICFQQQYAVQISARGTYQWNKSKCFIKYSFLVKVNGHCGQANFFEVGSHSWRWRARPLRYLYLRPQYWQTLRGYTCIPGGAANAEKQSVLLL